MANQRAKTGVVGVRGGRRVTQGLDIRAPHPMMKAKGNVRTWFESGLTGRCMLVGGLGVWVGMVVCVGGRVG
jgi:hypothetical protein